MKLYFFSAMLLVGSCTTLRHSEKIKQLQDSIEFKNPSLVTKYANSISENDLKAHLNVIASEKFNGRATGEVGHNEACDYLRNFYASEGLASPKGVTNYFQNIPTSYFKEGIDNSQNVIAYIEGSELPNEIIIISGHSDHEGVKDGEIYPGADDNGSGTSAILEMAQAFMLAKKNGNGPKRSIAFIHMTGEEIGLVGSRYYTENPIFPLKNTVANLNIDMIGRTDNLHDADEEYIYLIGSDRLSTELHFISEKANDVFTHLKIDYKYNDLDDHNRYYYRSDHYNFALKGIPVIFYFNGEHDDYHKPTDTIDKINFNLLAKRTKLVFATAWYLANSEKRIIADKL